MKNSAMSMAKMKMSMAEMNKIDMKQVGAFYRALRKFSKGLYRDSINRARHFSIVQARLIELEGRLQKDSHTQNLSKRSIGLVQKSRK